VKPVVVRRLREDAMQWFWNKKDDLGLARFVIYSKDSEAVKRFIQKAVQSSHLPKSGYDFHQTQNDGRRQLVEKIYNALRENKVEYDLNEYHELSGDTQLIRTPEEILDTQGKGTCLDLAILLCAICWHYDLLPILILVEGHALVAVSLTHSLRDWENEERRGQQLFWEGLGKLTDTRELQKMVKREDYLAIECTGFARSETLSECEDEKFQRVDGILSFDQAVELGCKQLTRPLKFALDIHIAYNFWWSKVVCQNRLEAEPIKRLINSPLTNEENPLLKLYVPLGLIERKPDAQRRPSENEFSPEGSSFNQPDTQYEVVREYEHKEFFEDVLKHKSSSRSQGKRLAIVGDPGGGKTTLLQRIAYWVLEEEQGLPIWVPLGDVNENWVQGRDETDEGWLYRYLSENWLKNVAGEPKKTPIELQQAFKELLKSGQVWLLLDGADEMAIRHPLTRVKEQLAKGWADSVRVVLNCRLNLWEVEKEALWEKFDIYRTLDFSYPEQVHQFINNWFGEDDPKAKELQDKLAEENRKRLQDLVKNPLRLALLCRIWKQGLGTLPETKADFYRLLVENHYKWKDESTNEEFDIKDRKEELNRALGQLARDAIDSEDFRFRLRESSIRKYLKDANVKDSLFWWALKLGWLLDVGFPTEEERNRGEKVYAFFHPTFQEYFAALAIADWDFFLPRTHDNDNPKPVSERYRIFEPQWKEVILLWLGREEVAKEQKEAFIKKLVKFEDGCGKFYWYPPRFYWYPAYFLAAAGIAEFKDCERAQEIVKQIVEWSFGGFDKTEKKWKFFYPLDKKALTVLRGIRHDKLIPALTELLQSCQDEQIRQKLADRHFDKILIGRVALTLLEIDPINLEATQAIKNLIENTDKYFLPQPGLINLDFSAQIGVVRNKVFWDLPSDQRRTPEINDEERDGSPEEVLELINLLQLGEDKRSQQIETILEKIRTGSLQASPLVLKAINQSGNCKKKTINILITILIEICNKHSWIRGERIKEKAILTLTAIGLGNQDVFKFLVNLIHSEKNCIDLVSPVCCLGVVLQDNLFSSAVTNLKDYLKDSVEKNNRWFYFDCYWTLWHCAQNMTYPAFYQAWHPQEAVGKTTTSDSQSLNQADLPQILQSAIANDPQLSQIIHLICIDGSQFIDPDNPALEIYDQMLDQKCSECDSVPETMPALKLYWNSLKRNSNKRPVLVFYASSTNPYSETFFTDLSKFKGDICIVTSPPTPLLVGEGSKSSSGSPSSSQGEGVRGWGSLQLFTPSQAIADVMQWIRGIAFS